MTPTPASPTGGDPDLIAAAVLACSTVVGLSGGFAGEVATYLPGRRVTGLRIDDTSVTVHVVGRYGPTMTEISSQVTRAVTPLAGDRQVGVVIEDLLLDDDGGLQDGDFQDGGPQDGGLKDVPSGPRPAPAGNPLVSSS